LGGLSRTTAILTTTYNAEHAEHAETALSSLDWLGMP
jgi:hypothetical protein